MPTDPFADPFDLDADALRYALSKQLGSASELTTDYGALLLDQELADAVAAAVRPILERRLEELEAAS